MKRNLAELKKIFCLNEYFENDLKKSFFHEEEKVNRNLRSFSFEYEEFIWANSKKVVKI